MPRSSKWSLPFCFPTKILYAPLLSPIGAACSAHLIFLDLEEYLVRSTNFEAPHSAFSSSSLLLHPSGVHLYSSVPYPYTSSSYVMDQVSGPYKTTGEIIGLYIAIFIFLDSKWEDKEF